MFIELCAVVDVYRIGSPGPRWDDCTWTDVGNIAYDLHAKSLKVCVNGIWQHVTVNIEGIPHPYGIPYRSNVKILIKHQKCAILLQNRLYLRRVHWTSDSRILKDKKIKLKRLSFIWYILALIWQQFLYLINIFYMTLKWFFFLITMWFILVYKPQPKHRNCLGDWTT